MTADEIIILAEQLAPRVASAMLDEPRFRLMLTEVALAQAAEQERLKREEVPRLFVAVCIQHGVHLRARNGLLYQSAELPPELERIKALYRDEIINFVMNGPITHHNDDAPAPAIRPRLANGTH